MKKCFSNKLFVFLIIALCVCALLVCPVFALETDVLPSEVYEAMSSASVERFNNSSYYVLFSNSDNSVYQLFDSSNELVIKKNNDSYNVCNSSAYVNYTLFEKTENGSLVQRSVGGLNPGVVSTPYQLACSEYSVVGSNYVVKDSTSDEVFFNPPLQVEGVLAPIVQETGMTGVLQEVMEILPIVLVTIVGLIGLRKALAMLWRVLHQS